MEQLDPHEKDFHESWQLSIFLKSVKKIQVYLKSYKNNGNFTWIRIYVYDIALILCIPTTNVSDKIVEKIKRHIYVE